MKGFGWVLKALLNCQQIVGVEEYSCLQANLLFSLHRARIYHLI